MFLLLKTPMSLTLVLGWGGDIILEWYPESPQQTNQTPKIPHEDTLQGLEDPEISRVICSRLLQDACFFYSLPSLSLKTSWGRFKCSKFIPSAMLLRSSRSSSGVASSVLCSCSWVSNPGRMPAWTNRVLHSPSPFKSATLDCLKALPRG